jgi:nitrite reductase (NADH) small subunit
VISLETGDVEGPDQGCASRIAVSLDQGRIRLGFPRASRAAHG